jgi:hypothetical protein
MVDASHANGAGGWAPRTAGRESLRRSRAGGPREWQSGCTPERVAGEAGAEGTPELKTEIPGPRSHSSLDSAEDDFMARLSWLLRSGVSIRTGED